jgi:putative aldouronate transport system substrate-binding protein
MRRTLKIGSLLMALILIMSLIAACGSSGSNSNTANSNSNSASNSQSSSSGGNTNTSGSTDSAGETLEPYELTMAYPIFGATPTDIDLVVDEINKITQAEINTTVTLLPISIGSYYQQMNLMSSSGEKLDLMFTFGNSGLYSTDAMSGKLLPLDDLLAQYGQGILEAVGAEYMESARIGGQIYGVPTLHSFAQQPGILMRKDIVEKYNIDVSSIKTIYDLDPVFKIVKENEPGMVPIAFGLSNAMTFLRNYDKLGDGYGVLPGFDNGLKIVNWYETEEYAELLNLMYAWFKAGYVNKDAATTQAATSDLVKADAAFSYITMLKPEIKAGEERAIGKELVEVYFSDFEPYATTTDVVVGVWGVAQQSDDPERAMMFLDMLYTNKELTNLFYWGIEGKHYVKVSDNVIQYPDGIDSTTVGYAGNGMVIGNPFIAYTFEGDDPNLSQTIQKWNEAAKKSAALGFTFNSVDVQNEMTAISNVLQQYQRVLETGSVDPKQLLPEFISQLKAAGIDRVIEQKQAQLDAWAAENK